MQTQYSTNVSCNHHGKTLSGILADLGAGFVLIKRGEKYPTYPQWQKQPKQLHEAHAWAKKGGNVGLLGGHNGLILLDADDNADGLVAIEPRLRDTVRIFRANAPERAKWIVRIVGELPPAKKDKPNGIEVLAAGAQGVIAGKHPSGAHIEWEGDQVIDLTADDVRRIWRIRTGTELGRTHRHEDAGPPDAEAVARSMALAETVLTLANVNHDGWQEYDGGGRKAILQQCPFNPPDNPHAEDQAAAVIIGADGRIGATCHHARCQSRIQAHGGGWSLLKELADYHPAPPDDLEHNRAIVNELRRFVRRSDLAEHIIHDRYCTRDTDTTGLEAILEVAYKRGRLTGLALPLRDMSESAGMGVNTFRGVLERNGWFVVKHPTADRKPWEAQLYDIAPALVAWAEDEIEFAQTARYVSEGDPTNQDNKRAGYANSPLVTHRKHDAFTASMTPITMVELKQRPTIAEKRSEIAAALWHNRQVDRRNLAASPGAPAEPRVDVPDHDYLKYYRRRLAAKFPSAGRGVLRMIDALVTDTDGSCSKQELRDLLNVSPSSLSRLIARARELGLVDADRHTVTLHEQWRDIVDVREPYMPTAGRGIARADENDDARITWAERELNRPGITPEEERRHRRRIARAARRKRERQIMLRPDLAQNHADVAPPSVHDYLRMRRLAEAHATARMDLAAAQRAEQWRLPLEVQRLRRDGISKGDAWRMLNMGGWSKTEIAGAMEASWPRQEVSA